MKYPCKTCLVEPACRVECNEYKKFIKRLSDLWSPIIICTFSLLVGISAFIAVVYYESHNVATLFIRALWIISSLIICILQPRHFFKNLFSSIFLAPIMAPSMIIWTIQAKLYKRF